MKFRKHNIIALAVAPLLAAALTITTIPVEASALSKKENIFVKMNNEGKTTFYTVRNQIINDEGKDFVEFKNSLENLTNLNNSNTFTITNDKASINAGGKDVYYSGTTDQELPIEMKLTYKLDGEEVDPNNIAGKSGKVETIFEFTNKEKQGAVFTPFVIGLTAMLDNSIENIDVTNGLVASNGKSQILTAISAPGLAESFNLEDLKSLDKIKIKYETNKFEIPSYYLGITPKLLSKADLKIFDKVDGLYDMADQLTAASQQVQDGADQLAEGTDLYMSGLQQFQSGIALLNQKGGELASNYDLIDGGINKISDAVKKLKEKLPNINMSEIDQEKVLSIISTAQETIAKAREILAKLRQINADAQGLKAKIESLSIEDVALRDDIQSTIDRIIAASQDEDLIENLIDEADNFAVTLNTYFEFAKNITPQLPTIQANIENAIDSLSKLGGYSSRFNSGLHAYTNGVNTLYNRSFELSNGASQINSGAYQLSDGVRQFNEEGINKINEFVNDNLREKVDRGKDLIRASKNYKTYLRGEDKTIDTKSTIIVLIDKKR